MKTIDLNCDMGESFGKYKLGNDDEIIKYISSANIACGFHAGDPNVMDHTVQIAKKHNVGIGVHPGFPDLVGFGRRDMDIPRDEFINLITYQIGALDIFCKKYGVEMKHFKPHGSLGNMADLNKEIATNIADAVHSIKPDLMFYLKPNSELHRIAIERGLSFKLEIYADRNYKNDFTLVPRTEKDAVLTDADIIAERVLKMVTDKKVTTLDGETLDLDSDTICVHGDTPNALEIIKKIRKTLDSAEIQVRPPLF